MFSLLNLLLDMPGRIYPTAWRLPNVLKIYEFNTLMEGTAFDTGQRVLDLGCGQGLQSQLIALRGPSVLGIDPVERFINSANYKKKWCLAASRLEFRAGTVEKMQLPAGSFDAVASFCVLEHIQNLAEVLGALYNLLKPGGKIHATVDALAGIDDPAVLAHHREKYHVQQYFQPGSLATQLEQAGFRLLSHRYILGSPLAREVFLADLHNQNPRLSQHEKKSQYRRLVEQETQSSQPDQGIMILFHAEKP